LDESNQELKGCAFTSLQIHTKLKRLEKVAQAKFNQGLLKKGLIGLAIAA
jgi:hypothetical protein